MTRIVKVGMDVHTTNYTLCAKEEIFGEKSRLIHEVQVEPEAKHILKFINKVRKQCKCSADEMNIECAYEAGCLGYSLYHELEALGIKCVIMAPTTMNTSPDKTVKKTDWRDAQTIADLLISGGFHAVHIPDEEDDAVKEYIRMRDDHQQALKKLKQQINALVTRHGYHYEKSRWTGVHRDWLSHLELPPVVRETLNEYLASLAALEERIAHYDQRIEEFSALPRYNEKVKRLCCFIGIETHTALSLIVETGDFTRFSKGSTYSSFLGLCPGKHSSSVNDPRMSITKAGNSHLRRLLIEASNGIGRGVPGKKSKALRKRQEGNPPEVIAYADKANYRLRHRFQKMRLRQDKPVNVAKTAVARELACFVWGMMTDNIYERGGAVQ